MQTQPVLEVISNRLLYRNFGLGKADNFKLGLAVEGGGMRGVLSIAMLMALDDLHMLDIFDSYLGISAGALNLAYVLAGQGPMGLHIYMENMTNGSILNRRRIRRHDSGMLDIRQLYQQTTGEQALDEKKLIKEHAKDFFVGVSNVTTHQGCITNPEQAGKRFHEYLMAGATMPVVSGRPWRIHNEDYFDGGLYYNDPAWGALELGCTHLLVLNTNYVGYIQQPHSRLSRYVMRRLDNEYNGAGSWYIQNMRRHAQTFKKIGYGETELEGMRLYRHATKRPTGVLRMTTDKRKLAAGTLLAYQSVVDTFYPQGRVVMVPKLF